MKYSTKSAQYYKYFEEEKKEGNDEIRLYSTISGEEDEEEDDEEEKEEEKDGEKKGEKAGDVVNNNAGQVENGGYMFNPNPVNNNGGYGGYGSYGNYGGYNNYYNGEANQTPKLNLNENENSMNENNNQENNNKENANNKQEEERQKTKDIEN